MIEQQYETLIDKITELTRDQKLVWNLKGESRELDMPNLSVKIAKMPNSSNGNCNLSFTTQGGFRFSGDDLVSREKVSKLFELAGQNVKSGLISDAINFLDQFESEIANPIRTRLAGVPTAEEEHEVFTKLKGCWKLEYHNGTEKVEITEKGLYSLLSSNSASRPKFQLKLIASNPLNSKIELAKNFADNGNRWDIEVLRLDDFARPKIMTGSSKGSRKPLAYRRVAS